MGLRPVELSLVVQHDGQVVQRPGHVGVHGAEVTPAEGKGFFEQRAGLGIVAQPPGQHPARVERAGPIERRHVAGASLQRQGRVQQATGHGQVPPIHVDAAEGAHQHGPRGRLCGQRRRDAPGSALQERGDGQGVFTGPRRVGGPEEVLQEGRHLFGPVALERQPAGLFATDQGETQRHHHQTDHQRQHQSRHRDAGRVAPDEAGRPVGRCVRAGTDGQPPEVTVQVGRQQAGRVVAPGGVGVQGPGHDGAQVARQQAPQARAGQPAGARRRLGVVVLTGTAPCFPRRHQHRRALPCPFHHGPFGTAPDQQFVKHHPQRIHIAGRRDTQALPLLRGRIGRRHERPAAAILRSCSLGRPQLRNAEVQQAHLPVVPDQDVGGLEVLVHDQVTMRVLYRRTGFEEEAETGLHVQPVGVAVGVDGPALDVFHGVIGAAVPGHPAVIEPGDAGVLQPGQQLPLHQEATANLRQRLLAGQEFQGDPFLEVPVGPFGQVDGSHAPASQQPHQAVGAHLLAHTRRLRPPGQRGDPDPGGEVQKVALCRVGALRVRAFVRPARRHPLAPPQPAPEEPERPALPAGTHGITSVPCVVPRSEAGTARWLPGASHA